MSSFSTSTWRYTSRISPVAPFTQEAAPSPQTPPLHGGAVAPPARPESAGPHSSFTGSQSGARAEAPRALTRPRAPREGLGVVVGRRDHLLAVGPEFALRRSRLLTGTANPSAPDSLCVPVPVHLGRGAPLPSLRRAASSWRLWDARPGSSAIEEVWFRACVHDRRRSNEPHAHAAWRATGRWASWRRPRRRAPWAYAGLAFLRKLAGAPMPALLIARFRGDVGQLTRAYDRAHRAVMDAGGAAR